jgi:hypothetical protein
MKNLIKLLISVLVLSSTVYAEEITFSNIFPPGGSTDIVITALSENLEKQGETVNRQYFKSCYDAIQYMNSNSKNNLIILDYDNMLFGNLNKGARCPPQVDYKNKISIYSSVYEFSFGLVSLPGFAGTSYSKLKELSTTGNKIRIGYTVGPYATYMIKSFTARNPGINFVLLPYPGTGALRPAYLARDFDLYYGSGLTKEIIERGGTLIAVTKRNTDVTFMGDLAEPEFIKNEFPEHQTGVMLVTSNLSSASQAKIASALKSTEVAAAIKKIDASPTGIAHGVSASETLKRVIDFEKKLEQISK